MQDDLRGLLAGLVQHLHDETAALIDGDADRVAAIAQAKSTLLLKIAPLAQRAGAASNSAPRDLLEQARALNDRNALLLAPRLVATRARLDALRQAGNPLVYGADGQAHALRTSTRA